LHHYAEKLLINALAGYAGYAVKQKPRCLKRQRGFCLWGCVDLTTRQAGRNIFAVVVIRIHIHREARTQLPGYKMFLLGYFLVRNSAEAFF
jgi:hypothetical protein